MVTTTKCPETKTATTRQPDWVVLPVPEVLCHTQDGDLITLRVVRNDRTGQEFLVSEEDAYDLTRMMNEVCA